MARGIHKLTALQIAKAVRKRTAMLADGGGLYLQNGRSWIFRYGAGGKHYLELGPLELVDLKSARALAHAHRKQLHAGVDPLSARQTERATTMPFDDCVARYLDAHRAGWRNAKHRYQWERTLAMYASPVFGSLPVAAVDTGMVMQVLGPLWASKNETASRLRGRIESILSWAKVHGYRSGENPAQWRGHLDHLLPPRGKVRKVVHHPSLAYDLLPAFLHALRQRPGMAALALELTILCATRTSETLDATWSEIDLGNKLWVIPAERMKGGRLHRIPLSAAAIALLERMHPYRDGSDLVFPGQKGGKPLSNLAMLMLLRRMQRSDVTVHGFRSSFRVWAAERTSTPREVVEAALAHVVGNQVELAYQRSDLLDRRRRLMEMWADFCNAVTREIADVVPLRA